MSTGILRALMQLFAIISGSGNTSAKELVAVFLRQQLNKEQVSSYLELFEEFVEKFHKGKSSEKKTSMASVKVLRICSQINEELQQKEKYFVVVRLLEFLKEFTGDAGEQENEFIETVAEAFNIDQRLFQLIKEHVTCGESQLSDQPEFLLLSGESDMATYRKHLKCDNLKGGLFFLRLEEENLFFVRYFGTDDLYLNSQGIFPGRTYVFGQGASIRGNKTNPIFYSDILQSYLKSEVDNPIEYKAENVSYYFAASNKQALHQFNLREEGGTLVGIMGGSGAGKSTCLNVLNGNYEPTFGNITINGIDIYKERARIQGVLGYVAQDDILIEELSVFQNLYYNARLCFKDMPEEELVKRVGDTLQSIGLYECKDLRVGSVLDKTISGGQRKRLNIALELIREPSVMFVDEPTSGLSSRDSENIMDLLKELTLRGKLIFVVIHQPSSDIFKMFDKLFILDQGGYPIYYGNPVESIIYFKRLANHVNLAESECPHCGNVNPEQIFNIIEAKVVDEYGVETGIRKVAPREWNNFYNVIIGNHLVSEKKEWELPKNSFSIPGVLSQFKVFVVRDVLSKLSNRQYMLITFLEAPVLALVLALFIKFSPIENGIHVYSFMKNINFPQYLFISVVVAIFLGLTVSAEEIIKDEKIRKRERYLNLSRLGYLNSKIVIMFFISLIQTFTFVAIGNSILEIEDMFIPFWMVLFATSCFGNILGLNISATFNSAKVIYIIIPLLVIPQLLFSGVLVRFDRLFPFFSSHGRVPFIGNVMVSRWAHEAMAVYQFKNNAYEREMFPYETQLKDFTWRNDNWIKELEKQLNISMGLLENAQDPQKLSYHLDLIRNELKEELKRFPNIQFARLDELSKDRVTPETIEATGNLLKEMHEMYAKFFVDVNAQKQKRIAEIELNGMDGRDITELRMASVNESLEDMLTNGTEVTRLVESEGRLYQKLNLIYIDPKGGFLDAHFYAPSKLLFGKKVSTLSGNLFFIWMMVSVLVVVLYFDGLKKLLNISEWIQLGWSKIRTKSN